ncbi:hypothetical protein EC973_009119 [Apophysomyces ossiformis]|uniref:peptidylprolyl isomerase n=1 Tax=Apophysomyces ossiformis TaxID=679940 RepID=A0A8H7BK45_9FUNG|nr:hypothetical protein EC973_009119 [Apophysomyces ossiformis]
MKINPRVFFDIDVDGNRVGRVIMELFADEVPQTAENFRALCTGEKGLGKVSNMPLHYRGSIFHRVIKGFMIQGGDFTRRNGTGGESIYGAQFPDESFARKHTTHGLLSMANRGPNTQSSQFFITTRPTPHLDGKHVVFGRVVAGYEFIEAIENQPVDDNDRPLRTVMVANCGELVLKLPANVQLKGTKSADGVSEKKRKRSRSVSPSSSVASDSDSDSVDSEEEERRKKKRKSKKKSKKEKKDKKKKKSKKKSDRDRSPSPVSVRTPVSVRDRSIERSRSPEAKSPQPRSRSPSRSPVQNDRESSKKRPDRSRSPPRASHTGSSYRPSYRRFMERDAERPEWEKRRRFSDDEPEVTFKGRGRVKYRRQRGGMRGW